MVEEATAPSRVRAPVAPPLYSHGLLISHLRHDAAAIDRHHPHASDDAENHRGAR